jgi:hypothetical protein
MNCAALCRPDDADGLVAAFKHDLERINDRRPHREGSYIDIVIDRPRQTGAGQQPALLPHLDRHPAGADAGEDLPRQGFRDHARRGGIEHESGRVRRRQAIVQPVHPEISDRGHIDQHLGDHHQGNGEQQQFARQAEPTRRLRPRREGDRLFVDH